LLSLSKSPIVPAPQVKSEVLSALIRRHMAGVAQDTPRRAVGYSVVLLPEDEGKLV